MKAVMIHCPWMESVTAFHCMINFLHEGLNFMVGSFPVFAWPRQGLTSKNHPAMEWAAWVGTELPSPEVSKSK